MKCKCGQKILQQLCVPNVYIRTIDKIPVFSYDFKCPNCGNTITLTKKQFLELGEIKLDK